jgi:hypothetical protein
VCRGCGQVVCPAARACCGCQPGSTAIAAAACGGSNTATRRHVPCVVRHNKPRCCAPVLMLWWGAGDSMRIRGISAELCACVHCSPHGAAPIQAPVGALNCAADGNCGVGGVWDGWATKWRWKACAATICAR